MRKILLPTSDGLLLLPEQEIYYVKSENIYSYVYNGKAKYFTTCALKEVELLLDSELFYRCHKSFIVNLNKIIKITKTQNCHLILTNGTEIPVSRSKKREILKIIKLSASNPKSE